MGDIGIDYEMEVVKNVENEDLFDSIMYEDAVNRKSIMNKQITGGAGAYMNVLDLFESKRAGG